MTDPTTAAYERGRAAGVREGVDLVEAILKDAEMAYWDAYNEAHVSALEAASDVCGVLLKQIAEARKGLPEPPSPWRRIPETPTPGVAPFDGRHVLICDASGHPVTHGWTVKAYWDGKEWRLSDDYADNGVGAAWDYWLPIPSPPHPEPSPDLEHGDGD